jgi:hypothetical protein
MRPDRRLGNGRPRTGSGGFTLVIYCANTAISMDATLARNRCYLALYHPFEPAH